MVDVELDPSFEFADLFSIGWWINYLATSYDSNPWHVIIEFCCIVVILYLLFKKESDPKEANALTEKEEDQIIRAWKPQPLVPELKEDEYASNFIVESSAGRTVVVRGHGEVLNFASKNWLGLASREETKKACRECIDEYGVGSCGPRGFYGSFDTHLDLEKNIADFYGVAEAILYSDGMACITSVIPAFSKKGDLLVVDEGVNYAIQQGITLSRSRVKYFKHNDMDDLKRVLDEIRAEDQRKKSKLNRRFIIVEGIYQDYGDVCPMDKVVEMKQEHKFRLLVDDSCALGVLGKTGKGSLEHWDLEPVEDVEALCANLDGTLGSCGGYCVGSHTIVDHQRLSGAGYVYSASAPPYTTITASVNLALIGREGKQLVGKLRANVRALSAGLRGIGGIKVSGDAKLSPLVRVKLGRPFDRHPDQVVLLKKIVLKCMENGVAVRRPEFIPAERNPPSPHLVFSVTVLHTEADISLCCSTFERVLREFC